MVGSCRSESEKLGRSGREGGGREGGLGFGAGGQAGGDVEYVEYVEYVVYAGTVHRTCQRCAIHS